MSAVAADVAPRQRIVFAAMGTSVELMLVGDPTPASRAALVLAQAEFHRLEGIFSRFRDDSELSALNAAGRMVVGRELLEVTELSLEARERTGGRFDPTVHDALVAAGYDRTFDEISAQASDQSAQPAPCRGGVRIDNVKSLIELDTDVRLDFGGIAKGFTVDRTCELLAEHGSCLINAGGDVRVLGGLDGGTWPVGVETPQGTVTLGLTDGAIATSGRDRRRWSRNGLERHHVIDPHAGLPSKTDLMRVTVVAAHAVEAEIQAKSLFLVGEQDAVREADERRVPCVLVTEDGRIVLAGGLL